MIYKGSNANIDSYSSFFDNQKLNETKLRSVLQKRGVTDVYVCGLATDFCVGKLGLNWKFTIFHSIQMFFWKYALYDFWNYKVPEKHTFLYFTLLKLLPDVKDPNSEFQTNLYFEKKIKIESLRDLWNILFEMFCTSRISSQCSGPAL